MRPIDESRRRLLAQGAAVFAGAAATLVLHRRAFAKAAKSELLYQDHPHEGKKCGDCKHFSPDANGTGTCAMVEGMVSVNGWCQAFSPKT
jgi:hypothetical protein